jgi:uncharacterized tellurite resistance protein B-like protein
MRSYQTDSNEAMARILALSMLADGGLDQSEIEVVADTKILSRLGMTGSQFQIVLHMLCEDMLQCMRGYDYGKIELDRHVIDQLLSEVTTPRLQKQLLRVMLAVVDADGKMSDGEAVLISQALSRWKCDLVDLSYGQDYQAYSSFTSNVSQTTVSSIKRHLHPA